MVSVFVSAESHRYFRYFFYVIYPFMMCSWLHKYNSLHHGIVNYWRNGYTIGCVENQIFWNWYRVRCKKLQFHHIMHFKKFQRYWWISQGPHFMSKIDRKSVKSTFFYFFLTNKNVSNLHRVMCKNLLFNRIRRCEKFHRNWWRSWGPNFL